MGFVWHIYIWPLPILKIKSQGHAYFRNEYLGNYVRYWENYYCHQKASHVWAFDWHVHVRPWPILKDNVERSCTFDWNFSYWTLFIGSSQFFLSSEQILCNIYYSTALGQQIVQNCKINIWPLGGAYALHSVGRLAMLYCMCALLYIYIHIQFYLHTRMHRPTSSRYRDYNIRITIKKCIN